MRTVLAFCALLVAQPLDAQTPHIDTGAIDAAVMREMESQKIVGAAVGVIRQGEIVYTRGYGFADLQSRTPADEHTIFNWASNSKPFMAIAAMQLVEKGRLDLDVGIHEYLPDLPAHLKEVTTRHLLCHQSGIPHYSNGPVVSTGVEVAPEQEMDPLQSVHRFAMSPLLFTPGAKKDYSSYAYVLLSAVVQAAGNADINQQLHDRVSKPLDLTSFQLDVPFDGQEFWTTGYKLAVGVPTPINDYAHFWKHGAGAYKSNIHDFAKFAVAVMTHRLIREETSQQMWTPQRFTSGEASTYGLGVAVSGDAQDLKVSHNGAQDETRTRMVIYPEQEHGIVVMCNTDNADPGKITTAIYGVLDAK